MESHCLVDMNSKINMNEKHPIHDPDPDVCCNWLCNSAGQRSQSDNDEIAKALMVLPYEGGRPIQAFPINPHDVWRLVK